MPKEPRLTEEFNSRSSDLEDDIAQRRLRELIEGDLISRNTILTVEAHIRVLLSESEHVISELVGMEASAARLEVTEGDEVEEEGYEGDVDSDDNDESNDVDNSNNNNNFSGIDDGDDLPDYIDDFVGMNVHARKKNIEHQVQEDDTDDGNDGDDEDNSSGSDEDEHYNNDNDEDYIRCNEEWDDDGNSEISTNRLLNINNWLIWTTR